MSWKTLGFRETNEFLDSAKLPKLNQEEANHLTRALKNEYIETAIKSLPT